ncbi:MAG: GntR family transcriptional regulator [Chloroflexi bacterium]|nr:GntR family transcriptional regulator [Chloroflexota bacterium]
MNKVSDIFLSHDSVISLHVQLHSQLRQLILSGRWQSGSRIPSESELTAYLKVSRSTVRLALQTAEIEGLIERTAGRGTFVAYLASNEHKNRLIAFVTYGFDSESHLLMLKGAEHEVKAHGYQLILSNVQSHQEELDMLQRLKSEYVAGVLLWPYAEASRPQPASAFSYREISIPMVLMDRQIYGMDYDCVTSDNYGGGRALMEHFVGLGHRNIVFLTHYETELLTVVERYRAYCDVMQEAGLTPMPPWQIGERGHEIGANDTFRSSDNLHSLERRQIKEYLFAAQPRPTAIFALNDYLAVLAARTLKLLDLQVPDVVSVGGFDDIDLAAHLEVPLTTVAQDMFLIGKRAAQLLLDRLGGQGGPPKCEIIPTELRIRSSTGVPVGVEL